MIAGAAVAHAGEAPGETDQADAEADADATALAALRILGFARSSWQPPRKARTAAEIKPLEQGLWNAYRGGHAFVRADALVHSDSTGDVASTASVAGEVAIPLCRLVAAEATAAASIDPQTAARTLAYDVRGGACLPLPVGRPFVQLGRQRAVRMSPHELPRFATGAYDGWSLDMEFGGYRFLWAHDEFDIGLVDVAYTERAQDGLTDADFQAHITAATWRRLGKGVREAQTFSLFDLRVARLDVPRGPGHDDPNPSSFDILFASFADVPLGSHLALAAGLGLQTAQVGEVPSELNPTATGVSDEALSYDVSLDAALGTRAHPLDARLRGRSVIEPWIGSSVVRGHQLSIEADACLGQRTVARVSLLGARLTRMYADGSASAPRLTAGATAEATVRLWGPLHGFARVDLARQLALPSADATSVMTLATQGTVLATVGLAAAIERRRDWHGRR